MKEKNELKKLEELILEFGNLVTMQMLGYVSVAPIYNWRKTKKIPHWAKIEINRVYKEKIR